MLVADTLCHAAGNYGAPTSVKISHLSLHLKNIAYYERQSSTSSLDTINFYPICLTTWWNEREAFPGAGGTWKGAGIRKSPIRLPPNTGLVFVEMRIGLFCWLGVCQVPIAVFPETNGYCWKWVHD